MTLSVNSDLSSAQVIPTTGGSFHDKVAYVRCYPTAILPEANADPAMSVAKLVRDQLPAFIRPAGGMADLGGIRDLRFGVAAYHDPEGMKLIPGSNDPLDQFAAILDRFLGRVPGQTLEGSVPARSTSRCFYRLGPPTPSWFRPTPGWARAWPGFGI